MKIKFNVELDTDNERDLELVDDLLERLQELKEMLEDSEEDE